jgi:hypothetical protein
MLFSDSRYADGIIFTAQDARKDKHFLSIFRQFPVATTKFYYYTWVEGDRIDILAQNVLGSAESWWQIMDFNPEIIDPFDIKVGATIRVPSV